MTSIIYNNYLARMLGLERWVGEDEPRLRPVAATAAVIEPAAPDPNYDEARIVTTSPRADRPRAVVFRDSFGSALVPFLAEHFSRAVYLWEYDIDPRVLDREQPRVVIQEWAGRRLSTRLPYDPFAAVSSSGEARR